MSKLIIVGLDNISRENVFIILTRNNWIKNWLTDFKYQLFKKLYQMVNDVVKLETKMNKLQAKRDFK